MKCKSFTVIANRSARDKKTLADLVDDQVNSFLDSGDVESVQSIAVDTEFQADEFGKAFVTVFYKPQEASKKGKSDASNGKPQEASKKEV